MPTTTKSERLSHREEIELIRALNAAERGGRRYRYSLDRLVESNLGLVHKLTNQFPLKNASVTYDDLFQEGVAGLIRGITKFDPTKGYRLSTYVYNWIRAYQRRYFVNQGRVVRVPSHVIQSVYRLNQDVRQLTEDLGRTPTIAEIQDIQPKASRILSDARQTASLDSVIGDESVLNDVIGSDDSDERYRAIDLSPMLDRLRATISERDFLILVQRYGLEGCREHTLAELSDEFGVSRARVHQVCNSVLSKLRAFI